MTGRKTDEVSKVKHKIQNRDKVRSQKIRLKVCGNSQIYSLLRHTQMMVCMWSFAITNSNVVKNTL